MHHLIFYDTDLINQFIDNKNDGFGDGTFDFRVDIPGIRQVFIVMAKLHFIVSKKNFLEHL